MQKRDPRSPPFWLDEARAFVGTCRWTYARTVPEHPHEYCLRDWLTPQGRRDFDAFVALIARDGYTGRFWRQQWIYLDVDGRKYWASRTLDKAGMIINRARLEDEDGRSPWLLSAPPTP